MKNKKIRKKLYIKIEKRQRSIRRPKRGCGYNVVTRLQKHVRSGRIVFIFAVLFVETRAYIGETAFCGFSCAILAFICSRVLLLAATKYALKNGLFKSRSTERKHHDNMFANLYSARPLRLSFVGIAFVVCCKNIRSTFERAPRPLALFIPLARFFVFHL